MRTLGLITKDPILQMNPSFYGGVQKSDKKVDPFSVIQSQKDQWNKSAHNAYIKDLVFHTDLDHPMGLHSSAVGLT
jgi:hypothetical protein